VVTGSLWEHSATGAFFSGNPHETFSLLAWAIYGVLAAVRFGARQPAVRCALSSIAGFAFLGIAMLGVEWLA
jgi:ABC-type transport system involved in cytochrome c biogenesis permease subunit